jgi:hypothetical protein
MRRPRLRFTIRRMMVAVAIVAAVLVWAINRPYPTDAEAFAAWYVFWSDGTMTTEEGSNMMNFRGTSWFSIVDWPDGRTGYYLKVRKPAWLPSPEAGRGDSQ